jgi:hypothetical protein
MVNTYMACGVVGNDLMVRVGKDNHDAAISAGAREVDFTGRPMRGMVILPAQPRTRRTRPRTGARAGTRLRATWMRTRQRLRK